LVVVAVWRRWRMRSRHLNLMVSRDMASDVRRECAREREP
jgi:hypothetical protein